MSRPPWSVWVPISGGGVPISRASAGVSADRVPNAAGVVTDPVDSLPKAADVVTDSVSSLPKAADVVSSARAMPKAADVATNLVDRIPKVANVVPTSVERLIALANVIHQVADVGRPLRPSAAFLGSAGAPRYNLAMSLTAPVGSPTVAGGPVVLNGVSWECYESMLELLGDEHPSLRLTYREGALEIMTTSPEHERLKTLIARLLELWALERGVRLEGYGAATFRKKAKERGLEPDECYVLTELREVPDIAIEVVHKHGGIDKLDVYAGLGIPEVWFWEHEQLVPYVLAEDAYVAREQSALLPELDLREVADVVRSAPDQTTALLTYRERLRQAR